MNWKLQDVQAILSVIIAFLCTGGVFVLVRFFWMQAARDVITKRRTIPTHNLLSLNTVGEVVDILWLLRADFFSKQYVKIIVQSICILLLTVASLLSALIARYSTRSKMLSIPSEVSGILAERSLQSATSGITVNETYTSMSRAKFPPNQLLDFLPNTDANWEYQPEQWTNGTWSMNCSFTELQEIPNVSVQECSGDILSEFPYLYEFFSDWPDWVWRYGFDGSGYADTKEHWKDFTMFVHATWGVRYESNDIFSPGECGCPAKEMSFRSFWFHFRDAPRSNSSDAKCLFTRGPVASLHYTGASCSLKRVAPPIPEDELYLSPGAAPDVVNDDAVASGYNMQFGARGVRESMQNVSITPITGEELALFYQAHLIAKDTDLSTQRTSSRTINVYTPITQVSLTTVILCCIGAFIVLIGLTTYYFFIFHHWDALDTTPQSKLDWMTMLIKREIGEEDNKLAISTALASKDEKASSTTSTYFIQNEKGNIWPTKVSDAQTKFRTSSKIRTSESSSLMPLDHKNASHSQR